MQTTFSVVGSTVTMMNFTIVKPTDSLRPYIKHYCFMESDIHDGDIVERVFPIENIQLMFHYNDPFVVFHKNDKIVRQPRSIISGLSNTYSDVSTNGKTGVVFVSFHPIGACHFFNFPLSEIENQDVDLSDIFYSDSKRVEELLYLKNEIPEKVAVIENFLLKRFSSIPFYNNLLIKNGVDIIKKHRGQITAASLSDKLSITTKTLERKFSHYLGKTTKQIIRLIRFQEVLLDFSNNKDRKLTERAYKNGYSDQSHFIHDFKTLSGYTPKEFTEKYPNFSIETEA